MKLTRRQDYDADVSSNVISRLFPNPAGDKKKQPCLCTLLFLVSDVDVLLALLKGAETSSKDSNK